MSTPQSMIVAAVIAGLGCALVIILIVTRWARVEAIGRRWSWLFEIAFGGLFAANAAQAWQRQSYLIAVFLGFVAAITFGSLLRRALIPHHRRKARITN